MRIRATPMAVGFSLWLVALNAADAREAPAAAPVISYPQDGTVFPPNFGPPVFRWTDASGHDILKLEFAFGDGRSLSIPAGKTSWTSAAEWRKIEAWSKNAPVRLRIVGETSGRSGGASTSRAVAFRVSKYSADARIAYRLVARAPDNPELKAYDPGESMFIQRLQEPFARRLTSPRNGSSSKRYCHGCHQPSPDGKRQMIIERRPNRIVVIDLAHPGSERTYDLDPPGVKVAKGEPGLPAWALDSARFAITRGHTPRFIRRGHDDFAALSVDSDIWTVDAVSGQASSLVGADEPGTVEYAPSWSADGTAIAFVRRVDWGRKGLWDRLDSLVHERIADHGGGLSGWSRFLDFHPKADFPDELFANVGDIVACLKKGVRYSDFIGAADIYTVPYNGSKGGSAKPLMGASKNGKYNSLPRYSPDGKWLAYCQYDEIDYADASGDIYLVPAQGGAAQKLASNLPGVRDSWPAWSSNGRWLAFVSNRHENKLPRVYLTEIDDQGNASVPVELPAPAAPGLSYNHPYFVRAAR